MPASDIEVTKVRRIHVPGTCWDIVATFDATMGDFRVAHGKLIKSVRDGSYGISLAGDRNRSRLTLSRDSETRARLMAAVLEEYDGARN